MWSQFRKWLGSIGRDDARQIEFVWHEVGPDNPFGVRVLDVRPYTQSVASLTQDPEIATSFAEQRHADGTDRVDAEIESSETVPCELRLPHNGSSLQGIVFKAETMDTKWDIYVYDSVFLFTRSWTGELVYRAWAEFEEDAIVISKIETSSAIAEIAVRAVYFLLASHAMGRVLPHPVAADLSSESSQQIAIWSFGAFGNRACYATFDDSARCDAP